ncbi:MAG: HesA/MoeB/ThiF family protein [Bacillota bacterium]|nr:HesA/MoeB/ThiF family protein [Thermoanaerobacteraceae bacterium]
MPGHLRNIGTLTPDEEKKIQKAKVCIVGCGGLGGYVVEMLARLGVGCLTVVDGDSFEESNLNRQILADTASLGRNKAITAQERVRAINPRVKVNAFSQYLSGDNSREILAGHDLVIDALDDIDTRFLLQETAEELNTVVVHAAVESWYGQVCTIFPGDRSLDRIYPNQRSLKKNYTNNSFTPALIAAIQVSEALKVLIGRGNILRKRVLYVDLLEQEYHFIELET